MSLCHQQAHQDSEQHALESRGTRQQVLEPYLRTKSRRQSCAQPAAIHRPPIPRHRISGSERLERACLLEQWHQDHPQANIAKARSSYQKESLTARPRWGVTARKPDLGSNSMLPIAQGSTGHALTKQQARALMTNRLHLASSSSDYGDGPPPQQKRSLPSLLNLAAVTKRDDTGRKGGRKRKKTDAPAK